MNTKIMKINNYPLLNKKYNQLVHLHLHSINYFYMEMYYYINNMKLEYKHGLMPYILIIIVIMLKMIHQSPMYLNYLFYLHLLCLESII